MGRKKEFNVGLVFPEIGEHDLKTFEKQLGQSRKDISLLVFPEGFETVVASARVSSTKELYKSREFSAPPHPRF